MESKNAVVLLSGGLDSGITALYLKEKGFDLKGGVFVNRGQSNYEQEFRAAFKVAEYLEIPMYRAEFSIPNFENLLSEEVRKKLGIPARNLIMASLALPYIVILDCGMLALGNIVSDWRPDCSSEFRSQFGALASHTLDRPVGVVAPLADWERWDKVDGILYTQRIGREALFAMTWTCWMGGKIHCGKCGACVSRKEGFAQAGLIDPVPYEA